MKSFNLTTHLSKILEESEKNPIIIFKYSSECRSSDVLKEKILKSMENKIIPFSVYIVTVQLLPVLSKKIEEIFNIKHETPQIIIVKNGKVLYSAHHSKIQIEDFVYN